MVRQISNLFRIMKSIVWRQKSNMIKKQDSSFSYRNHGGLTPSPSPNGEGSGMWGYPFWPAAYFVMVLSLTELTDLSEPFCAQFNSWGVFSLTELTDLTDPFCAQFRTHRRPSAYRYHRGLTPSPSPNGEGSSMWGYPFWPADRRRKAAKHLEDM